AIDCGNYFRIPSDNRDLNYAKYFTEGNNEIRNQEEYNSDNTNRVNVEEVKKMLLKLPYIQHELESIGKEASKDVMTELV
ncbi:UDP-glucose 4-epimerase, partial [Clostridium perfringens]|nr:UDP-glucose 4-epimerase [Clostridium perfringens]